MEWSAASDPFKLRLSPPQSSPDPNSTMQDTNISRRTGVESREEVLRQARENEWQIIEIDPEPVPTSNHTHQVQYYQPGDYTPRAQSTHALPFIQKRTRDAEPNGHTQPAKQRKLSGSISAPIDTTQTEEQQSASSMLVSANDASTTQNHAQKPKKSLWCSDRAKENMLKISTLPSPESTSSSRSLESTSTLHRNESGLAPWSSSWSFEDIGEPSTTYNSNSTVYSGRANAKSGIERPSHQPPGRNLDASLNSLEQKRKHLEQNGVTASQRLRAQHQSQTERPILTDSIGAPKQAYPPKPNDVAQQGGDGQDAARANHSSRSPNRDEDDPAELERYFDILMDHKRSQQSTSDRNVNRRQGNRPHPSHSSLPSPYSRAAAEKWRTQGRHLDDSRQVVKNLSSKATNEYQVPDPQDREIRIALVRAGAYQNKQKDREAERRLLSKGFYGVDLEDRSKKTKPVLNSKPPPRTKAEAQSDLQKLMGTAGFPATRHETNGDELKKNLDQQNEKSEGQHQRSFPVPTLSALTQLGSTTKGLAATSTPGDPELEEAIDNLPDQGNSLNLPISKHSHRFTDSEKQVFVERETKKEREKDLDLIRAVFTSAAQLGSLDALDTSETKLLSHMSIIRKFTEAILKNNKSGKSIRHRIRPIRDTFKRRLEGLNKVPNNEAADEYLQILLQSELFDKLASDSKEVKDRLPYLQAECNRITSFYHSRSDPRKNRPGAKVSFSTRDSTGKLTGSNVSSPFKALTKKQSLAELHALRDQYNQNPKDHDDEVETIDLGPSRDDDSDGEISEEDEGEDFMRPTGLQREIQPTVPNEEISLEEVNRPENDRQEKKAHSVPRVQPSQAVNQQLLNSMLAKRQQQDHLKSQGVQKSNSQIANQSQQRKSMYAASVKQATASVVAAESEDSEEEAGYDIDQESSQEFDDSDIDAEDDDNPDDEDSDNGPVCRRYVAKAICHGISKKLDEDEHLLGNYLEKGAAREKVHEFMRTIKKVVSECHPELESDTIKESMSETKRSFEQKVVFGDGEDVVCRAWFVEELHSPSEEAYKKAKVYRACKPTSIWFVDWERTIAPYEEPEEDEESEDKSMEERGSSITLGNEDSPGEDASVSESASVKQTIHPESDHDMDAQQIFTEPNQSNEDLVSPDSPVESPLSSSAATLVPEASDNTKDHLMPDAKTPAEIEIDNAIVDEDMDDLFGGELDPICNPTDLPTASSSETSPTELLSQQPSTHPSPILTSRQTTTTRPTPDQLRFFTTRSLANRHAKDVFMHWFIERLPGNGNLDYIAGEDDSMEEQLKEKGDQSCWEREEEFYRPDENVPGGEVKVTDRLRVWVREGKCSGPNN